jgi:ubiquinol-cytochrome c reductase iron-sulfur subunit
VTTALWRLLRLLGIVRGVVAARDAASDEDDTDPRYRELVATPRSERGVAALLVSAGVAFGAFAVLIAIDADPRLLGSVLGAGLACLSAAAILAGLWLVPQEVAVEERPGPADDDARIALEHEFDRGTDGISRRRLLAAAAGVAGTGLAAAAVVPITALGPSAAALDASPWRADMTLVDEDGAPLVADDIEVGSFVTAFPDGADKRELGSPVIVVRVDPATLALPPARRDWAPEGLVAYSKICTHAGCAVTMFRYPLDEQTSGPPALVCPCHYSTFDVRRAAKVTLGPAGRPLPQLPLRIDDRGRLLAGGPLSGSVGPAWWGTNRS